MASPDRSPTGRRGRPSPSRRFAGSPEILEDRRLMATFLVTNDQDLGDGLTIPGTLRAAIEAANALPGADRIEFAVQSNSPDVRIGLDDLLPALTDPVTIDGYTQPGAVPNTATLGTNAAIRVTLASASDLPLASALTATSTSGGVTIRGLAFDRFADNDIVIQAPGTVLEGNFLGTTADGLNPSGEPAEVGVLVGPLGTGSRIGGDDPAARNLISGNLARGIEVRLASAVEIRANLIGTNATGDAAIGNGSDGVIVATSNSFSPSAARVVSGTVIADNVISGNGGNGVVLTSDLAETRLESNVLTGNRIGIDAGGTAVLPNSGVGVVLGERTFDNDVGLPTRDGRNLIAGNLGGGVLVSGSEGSNNRIRNNDVGLGFGNGGDGVRIVNLSSNSVGGVGAIEGNSIARNRGRGVAVVGGLANTIQGNSITENDGLGIALVAGGNANLAAPRALVRSGSDLLGLYRGAPDTTYLIESFANPNRDPSGAGEGARFVGRQFVTTDGNGEARFTQSIPPALRGFTAFAATATDPSGNTSAFGPNINQSQSADLSLRISTIPVGGVVPVAGTLKVEASILNSGFATSTPAISTLTIPEGVKVLSIEATGGSATLRVDGSAIDVALDPLAANASAAFNVTVRPDRAGDLTFNATVTAANDLNPANDSATADATAVYTFVVTNTDDSGLGSLRQVLLNAAANPGAETISFAIPGVDPFLIRPRTPLPDLIGRTVLLGSTQPGFDGRPVVEIRGDALDDPTAATDGLVLRGQSNLVNGLAITQFPGAGIDIFRDGGGGHSITQSDLGTNRAGTAGLGNGLQGIRVRGGESITIGGVGRTPQFNVISGNHGGGILIEDASVEVNGNRIGTDRSGRSAIPNGIYGIAIATGQTFENSQSPTNRITDNVISGNDGSGLAIVGESDGFTSSNLIIGNRIGTSIDGLSALPNTGDGILITGEEGTQIGASSNNQSNLVAGNGGNGVHLVNASDTGIYGNRIGTDATGTRAIPNLGGVAIEGSSNGTRVGFPDGFSLGGNLISGNSQFGVFLNQTSGVGIFNNWIGTTADRSAPLPNSVVGIYLENAPNNLIGLNINGYGNLIAGNGQSEVILAELGTYGTTIQGNEIGPGRLDGGQARAGIFIVRGGGNLIGGPDPFAGNQINGSLVGIDLVESSQNRIFGNDIGTIGFSKPARPNSHGILIRGGSGNQIGGMGPGEGNTISGNEVNGLWLNGADTTGNVVEGNVIGLEQFGTFAVANDVSGVFIDNAPGNVVGGTLAGSGNIISGNRQTGLAIVGPGASGNFVLGNRIGTDAGGSVAIPNRLAGVLIFQAPGTILGGADPLAGNTLSGNGGAGVQVFGNGSTGTQILGNQIGVAADGASPLGNEFGVFLNAAPTLAVPTRGPGANLIAFNTGGDLITQPGTANPAASRGFVPGPGATRRFMRRGLSARRRA